VTDVLSIPLDQIYVPEDYVRPLDEGSAQRLARLIEREGQKAPIAVYSSKARQGGEKPYTLIYGARRLRAMAILERGTIEAVLRTKAEALMLSIADNFATTTLDPLEKGEHVATFAELWVETNGPISHGGDRRSRFPTETLKRKMDLLEKSSFYKDLSENFGISKSAGWRLLKIGNMHPSLRAAIRGTPYAKDQTYLRKLIKYDWNAQAGIAGAMKIMPDLYAVLRMDDPATGRKGVGRMETGDWREDAFLKAWEALPRERRAGALGKIRAMTMPLDPWPADFPEVQAVPAAGNQSPLWEAMRHPMGLVRHATYAQSEAAKAEYEAETERAKEAAAWAELKARRINEAERENRAEYERQKAKALAAKSRKPKRGRPADAPEVKREKLFRKLFRPELADNLLLTDIPSTHPTIRYLKTCDADDQFAVACHLGNEHSYELDDVMWRVERSRGDRET
jgi:ParB family chromosome partitioning protein